VTKEINKKQKIVLVKRKRTTESIANDAEDEKETAELSNRRNTSTKVPKIQGVEKKATENAVETSSKESELLLMLENMRLQNEKLAKEIKLKAAKDAEILKKLTDKEAEMLRKFTEKEDKLFSSIQSMGETIATLQNAQTLISAKHDSLTMTVSKQDFGLQQQAIPVASVNTGINNVDYMNETLLLKEKMKLLEANKERMKAVEVDMYLKEKMKFDENTYFKERIKVLEDEAARSRSFQSIGSYNNNFCANNQSMLNVRPDMYRNKSSSLPMLMVYSDLIERLERNQNN
jgi:hypothetical protein